MKNIYIIAKRELRSYFVSPLAYVLAFIFLILSGYFFISFIYTNSIAGIGYLINFILLALFICPIMTIKLISEEKKSGTIELLLTSPISTLEVVIGKFLSSFLLYAIILSITLAYVVIMEVYSTVGPDYGVVFSAYTGLLLFGGSLISIGVFASSLTSSQVIAGVISFGVSLFFLLADQFARSSGFLSKILGELSLLSRYIDFHRGILNIENIIFYTCWICISLLLANKAVESHVWK